MPLDDGTTADTNTDPAATPDTGAVDKVTPNPNPAPDASADERSQADTTSNDLFAALDVDTREWFEKRGIKEPTAALKLAHEQSKLLGNAIRVPGKNATEEERNEFLNKLGRPETSDKYDFEPPKDLPESLPYDAERAKEFKDTAHKLGLTNEQAANLHDWYVNSTVTDFKSALEQQQTQNVERAKAETEKLTKRWGPLDSPTAQANLEFADRALAEAAPPELVEFFKEQKLIGPNKEVFSEPLAVFLSNVGTALFKEDGILKGNPDRLGNPFADGEHFNATKQMQIVRTNREDALSLIAAAGKKPSDFGLSA